MSQILDKPVKTFSIGFNEDSFNELKYARVAAKHFNTEHHEFTLTPDFVEVVDELVWHFDEPFSDSSALPTYMVSKMARDFVTVVLSGDGGDELFAGYTRYVIDRERSGLERLPGGLSPECARAGQPGLAARRAREKLSLQRVAGRDRPVYRQRFSIQPAAAGITCIPVIFAGN